MDDVRIHVAELFRDWLQDSSIRRKNTMWLAAGKTSVIIYPLWHVVHTVLQLNVNRGIFLCQQILWFCAYVALCLLFCDFTIHNGSQYC